MSVDLIIDWPGGNTEVVPLASYRGMSEGWKTKAEGLGLKWIPLFHSFLPIHADNLAQVLDETRVFREEVVRLGKDYEQWLESVDRMIAALERLKQLPPNTWSASVG
jgi:hypothetical protein